MSEAYEYRIAEFRDIPEIKRIHGRYHVSTISDGDKKDGFVTTNFTDDQLEKLVREKGFFVCLEGGEVVGYVTSASWEFWKEWPMYRFMIGELPGLKYPVPLSTENSYQYGPVCVDASHRGRGILERLFEISLLEMGKRYDYVITFINKMNPRSYAVHTRKLRFEVIGEFSFNGNDYYELIHPVRR
jgi:hypothetical protein